MLDELFALSQIAEIDTKAYHAENELKGLPERIAAMEADVTRLSELLTAEQQELAEAERLLNSQDQEIANQNQALAKSKSKSAHARTTRETDAVERELEVIRRTLKDREAERDTLREAIAKRKSDLEKHAEDFAKLEEAVGKERAVAEERMAALKAELDGVLAGRAAYAARVSGTVLRRYDLIRSRRGIGVAHIKGESCLGCNVSLSPQLVIKVQRGESVEQCPNCQRFLYSRRAELGDA